MRAANPNSFAIANSLARLKERESRESAGTGPATPRDFLEIIDRRRGQAIHGRRNSLRLAFRAARHSPIYCELCEVVAAHWSTLVLLAALGLALGRSLYGN